MVKPVTLCCFIFANDEVVLYRITWSVLRRKEHAKIGKSEREREREREIHVNFILLIILMSRILCHDNRWLQIVLPWFLRDKFLTGHYINPILIGCLSFYKIIYRPFNFLFWTSGNCFQWSIWMIMLFLSKVIMLGSEIV